MTSIFGTVVDRNQVGQAAVSLLQTPPPGSTYPFVVYHLAEVERQLGLQPRTLPVPQSFHTGLDFENWQGATLPALIAVAQPTGDAERYHEGAYGQWYEIQVAAVVEDPTSGDETTAQALADRYGAAVMLCLVQNGALAGPWVTSPTLTVEKTVLVSAPRTALIPDAQRWLAMSVTTVHSFVEQVVQEDGPQSFGPDPYVAPGNWPTITAVDIQLQSESPLGAFSAPSGVTVSEPVSGGTVQVSE